MSEHEQPKPSEGIVTSDTAQGKKHLPKKTLLVGGVVIIILLAVTCLVLYRYHHQSTNNAPVTTSNNIPTTQQLKAAITNSQADVKNAKTPAQKAGAYQSLGNNYLNNSETTDAIVAFNNAIAADSTIKLGVLGALAYSYALNGQSSQAIASYQELISLLQQQKPTQSSTQYTNTMKAIQSYQDAIQTLQQGGSI